ncbi:helix-turn-helix domain-containing protein [Pseudomonas monteilii]|uniref:helix-turn-helix domain-containing protein n=1 Tax=Pseudomonas monteilii TaxID=76759 RepID=UPI00383A4CCC
MVSIGERLREEREALEWSQEKMAAAAGITKKTQGLYERNERSPSADYLAALSGYGVDVLYVVTGARSPVLGDEVTAEAAELLRLISSISGSDVAILLRMAKAFAVANASS